MASLASVTSLASVAPLVREAAAKLEKLLAQQKELEKRIAELQGKLAADVVPTDDAPHLASFQIGTFRGGALGVA